MQGLPFKLTKIKVPTDKANPHIGVSMIAWSFDGSLLATKNDNNPNCVWIWDMTNLEQVALLVHILNVKSMQWSPKTLHLVIATGSPRIYIWSKGGASICDIPYDDREYNVTKIKWSPNGRSLLVMDKVRFKLTLRIT
jgi:WD40 repeat protein